MNKNTNHTTRPSSPLRKLSCLLLAVATLSLGACVQDEDVAAVPQEDGFQVRLLVDPQASQTRAAGDEDDVSTIQTLRVYVFNAQNERVGHYYNGSLGATGEAYYVPLRLSEGGNLSFYVVANEQGAGLTLSEETPKATLDAQAFETAAIVNNRAGKGDLLTGRTANVTVTEQNAQGDQVLVVECPLSRPFSLLEVYFAKTDESLNALVNSVQLYDYSTNGFIYETPAGSSRTYENGPASLVATSTGVTVVVPEEEHGQETADYGTPFASRPVTLNPYGNDGWEDAWQNAEPTTTYKPRLVINYTVGSTEKTETVYLPPMTRTNCRYNVKCLIKADGVRLQLNVLPWEYITSEIVWEDQADFDFTVGKQSQTDAEGVYYPISYTASNDPQNTNDVFITFTLREPAGMRWVASIENGQDFFFCDPNNSNPSMADNYVPGGYASDQAVTIRLKAFGEYNPDAPQHTRLAIRVLSADGTWNRLMINQEDQTAGAEDVILIKQVPNQ